ncbi:hypothetical protein NM208_g14440 [Fusarium decemcellulare]|uniref:Uncharacterized protein n=1 Tax=Fusarium decemcellulare TaxID=57161 RepID=A0ACC1RIP2_9HYPO|nr:hypothetical protein NM208_g14440 [Fusarium decemcellulare]
MWSSQRPMYRRDRQPSVVPPAPAPPLGDLIESITRDSLKSTGDASRAGISDAKLVASYNWTSASSPEIIIPGQPPRWTPPKTSKRLPWDSGDYYRDINAASYPKHPLEPAIVSVMKMNPDPIHVNIVACGSTIGNLLRFARGVDLDHPFRILVEAVGDTVHLTRRENSPKQLIPDVRGYGHTFPEAYTTWDPAVRRSTTHQRIMAYRFGGLDLMVRFEGDGFIRTSNPRRRQSNASNALAAGDALAQIQGLSINKPLPTSTSRQLEVSEGGEIISQESIFDLKTRSVRARERDTLGEQLPRLWISQVTQFLLAYHERGLFNQQDIEIKNVKDDIAQWEEANQPSLKKLAALLHLIIDRARSAEDGKLELVWSDSDSLEIRKQLPSAGDVLSAPVRKEWEAWLSQEDEESDSETESTDEVRWDDYLAALSDSDGEASDYAACDKECGYCGKCMY